MIDLYTSMADLLISVKYNLMRYSIENIGKLREVKSWNIGFVFPETVYPAVSVFPLSKTFLGVRSDGVEVVEYRFSVDIYAARNKDLNVSKSYVLMAAEEVKKAIKKSIRMIDKNGIQHSFGTTVESQSIHESDKAQNRGLSVSGSVQVLCRAYHQMNPDRIKQTTIQEQDFDAFIDTVTSLVKKESITKNYGVKSWVTRTAKAVTQYPAVAILPGNEIVEEHSGLVTTLVRPLQYHVVTRGIPKWKAIKANILLADNVLDAIELHYMVEGYAQQFGVSSIGYSSEEKGFMFASVINTEYWSRNTLETIYS